MGFGKYIVLLNFIVDELIYGGPIKITLLCEEDKELTKVNEFRKEYGFTKKEHDDQKLKQILKKKIGILNKHLIKCLIKLLKKYFII